MNTPNEWKTTATVTNPERSEFWQSIFGDDKVPVVSFIPQRANLPGHPDALVYMLDLRVISEEQRKRLVRALAGKFGLTLDFVDANLEAQGVPILADDVSVTSTDRALVMGAIL